VTIGDQDSADAQQRIEMAHRRCRDEKSFHSKSPLSWSDDRMALNADAAPATRPKHGLADQHWRAALQFDNRRNKPRALSRLMLRGLAVVGEDTCIRRFIWAG
jgi:hypothetical protein